MLNKKFVVKNYILRFVLVLMPFQILAQNDIIKPSKVLEAHTYKINYIRFSEDGKYLASGGWDNYTILWDMESFSKIRTLDGHSDWIREVNISPNNKIVVSGSQDGSVKIWDLLTGELMHTIVISPQEFVKKSLYPEFDRKSKNAVCALAFSPDGKYLVIGTLDEFIRFWDLDQHKLTKKIKAHTNGTGYITFNTEGNVMISGSIYNELIVWDFNKFKPLKTIVEYRGYNSSFEFLNNDKQLINTANDTINVWDIWSGKLLRSIPAQDMLQSVQLTPDQKYMVTCGEDHKLKLWNFESGQELWSYSNPKPELADCKISPNGELLALATPEGKVLVWYIDELIKRLQ